MKNPGQKGGGRWTSNKSQIGKIFDCWDVPLLRILRKSGMIDMDVRDGWDIYPAIAHCLEIKQLPF